jgi:uncharacterized protein (DUF885 family)
MKSGVGQPDQLAALAKEYWDGRMSDDPLLATVLGDRRFEDKLPDISPEARSRREEFYESVVRRCSAISEDGLSKEDRLTKTALLVDARSTRDYTLCNLEDWVVDPLQGPQVEFMNMESYQPAGTPAEGLAMVRRWNAIRPYFDQLVENLGRGAAAGRTAVDVCVKKVVDELEELVEKSDSEWGFLRPLAVTHTTWTEGEKTEFREGLTGALRKSVRPAYSKYLQFLKTEIATRARPEAHPGVSHIPGGMEDYRRLIRFHTSLDLTPEELHQTGLDEVARVNAEMESLGKKVLGAADRKQVLEKLRSEPSLYFTSRDEVAEKAAAALARAKSAIGRWFGRLPKADCEVVRMGAHEEKHSTIAYYRQPAADGSRPGRYYISTFAPETRPRYEAEALAYHESIPGHHLQIAIAQELRGIPEFRRNGLVTVFVEGWGLYSERLADEIGLYSSDLDRIGMLSYDAWRACRLVVDTGMHAMGWTRRQAIDFMLENTALAKNNIVNEVDRYITWPGQALAYKTGQLEMMRLRERAKERLGESFDIRKFHDVLLGSGAVPLEALRQIVMEYAGLGNG